MIYIPKVNKDFQVCSLQKYLEWWPAVWCDAGRSVLMLMKGHKTPRIEHSTVNLYQHYPLFMHNKLQYTWPGNYWVCAACPTPRLNLTFELRPSWNNIHNTFTTGTMQHTTELLSVRCEVKTRGACTYEDSKGLQHHLRGNQFERERHHQSSVQETADTASSGFESEPAEAAALVHLTG